MSLLISRDVTLHRCVGMEDRDDCDMRIAGEDLSFRILSILLRKEGARDCDMMKEVQYQPGKYYQSRLLADRIESDGIERVQRAEQLCLLLARLFTHVLTQITCDLRLYDMAIL